MTIQVVCECGFRKEVPDGWLGMRVTCKCGRSFVISTEGSVYDPPVAAPPKKQDEASPVESPPAASSPAASSPAASSPAASSPAAPPQRREKVAAKRSSDSVAARYRARHKPTDFRRRLVLGGGIVIALACLGFLAFVLRDQFQTDTSGSAQAKSDAKQTSKSSATDTPAKSGKGRSQETVPRKDTRATSGLARETGRIDSRIAEAIELEADDGLLMTGMFGDKYKLLECSEEQSAKLEELAMQFKTQTGALKSGEIDLAQWYIDGDRIGSELLATLTDPQRTRLLEMLEAGEIIRVRLEEFAATVRPELETPSISWRIEADGVPLPVIRACNMALTTNGQIIHTMSASGVIAAAQGQLDSQTLELWDLLGDKRIGSCQIPSPAPDDTTLVAQGGRFIVRGSKNGDGDYQVQVWSIDSEAAPKSKALPSGAGSASYQLVDCVANRVLCTASDGYWLWNVDTDETRETKFPDWVPAGRPVCAVSPGGRLLAVTHRHSVTVDSKQYHFVEIGIYDLDTGELSGNQVIATDYRPLTVGAIAFSYNGRELALLWDVDPPEPQRMLVQLSAVNGRVLRIAGGLPTADTSYARQKNLMQRELIWLPDNSGWVVGLRGLADTESEAVIDIELPATSESSEADGAGVPNIIDAIPAGNHRLLILTAEPAADDSTTLEIRGRIIDLPELGPFL